MGALGTNELNTGKMFIKLENVYQISRNVSRDTLIEKIKR